MSPEVAASAFDFFSQSESSRDRSRGGLGLGLALARGLVELHGGQPARRQ
jgi:signal transduction histidine kinase